MKILWVNAIDNFSEVETRYPNVGIAYLISSLNDQFGDIFDFRIVSKNIELELEGFSPDLVCISSVSQNYNLAKQYAYLAKKKNIPVLIGGVHITFLPETLTEYMDVGILGEGEKTLVDLVGLFLVGGVFDPDDLQDIPGIIYKGRDGNFNTTRHLVPCRDLDALPMPTWSYLPTSHHMYLFSSRGCPYRCNFCASSRFWDNVRYFSAERVVEEVQVLHDKFGATFISFFDDLFVSNKKRLLEISDEICKKGLHKKVKFSCSLRANTANDEVVEALREMNVVSVGMGLESGSQRVLTWLKGPGISIDQNYNAIRLLQKNNIKANASFVIGSPDETENEILDTLKFVKNSKIDLFDVYVLTPFPGTPVWEIAKDKGLVSEDDQMDWSRLNVNFHVNPEKAIILSDTLSREDIYRLYKKFRKYRLLHNSVKALSHPMIIDLPRYLYKSLNEKVNRIFQVK